MKLPAKWQKTRRVEVEITGRIQTRAEFEASMAFHSLENKLQFRAIVDHPNGCMEWQWCETLDAAKQWIDMALGRYVKARFK